jgi:hypothetical protein
MASRPGAWLGRWPPAGGTPYQFITPCYPGARVCEGTGDALAAPSHIELRGVWSATRGAGPRRDRPTHVVCEMSRKERDAAGSPTHAPRPAGTVRHPIPTRSQRGAPARDDPGPMFSVRPARPALGQRAADPRTARDLLSPMPGGFFVEGLLWKRVGRALQRDPSSPDASRAARGATSLDHGVEPGHRPGPLSYQFKRREPLHLPRSVRPMRSPGEIARAHVGLGPPGEHPVPELPITSLGRATHRDTFPRRHDAHPLRRRPTGSRRSPSFHGGRSA